MPATPPCRFETNSWVLYHRSVPGANRPVVGYVLAVLDPGEALPDEAELAAAGIDTSRFDLSKLAEGAVSAGERRYVIAVPNLAAADGRELLVVPHPARLVTLTSFGKWGPARSVDQLGSADQGSRLRITSDGSPQGTRIEVGDGILQRVARVDFSIVPDAQVVARIEGLAPDLSLHGRIIAVEPFEPSGE